MNNDELTIQRVEASNFAYTFIIVKCLNTMRDKMKTGIFNVYHLSEQLRIPGQQRKYNNC